MVRARLLPTYILPMLLGALSACHSADENDAFTIEQIRIEPYPDRLELRFEQQLGLSREAREALRNGVPLTIQWNLELKGMPASTGLPEKSVSYLIRYLPLSDHYELSHDDEVNTFPRLRHLLAELSRLRLTLETDLLAPGSYELLVRCHLDNQRLPPPMRLPAAFSNHWQHDTGWTRWPVTVEPGP